MANGYDAHSLTLQEARRKRAVEASSSDMPNPDPSTAAAAGSAGTGNGMPWNEAKMPKTERMNFENPTGRGPDLHPVPDAQIPPKTMYPRDFYAGGVATGKRGQVNERARSWIAAEAATTKPKRFRETVESFAFSEGGSISMEAWDGCFPDQASSRAALAILSQFVDGPTLEKVRKSIIDQYGDPEEMPQGGMSDDSQAESFTEDDGDDESTPQDDVECAIDDLNDAVDDLNCALEDIDCALEDLACATEEASEDWTDDWDGKSSGPDDDDDWSMGEARGDVEEARSSKSDDDPFSPGGEKSKVQKVDPKVLNEEEEREAGLGTSRDMREKPKRGRRIAKADLDLGEARDDRDMDEAESKNERRRAIRDERRDERGEFEDTREARREMDEAESRAERSRAAKRGARGRTAEEADAAPFEYDFDDDWDDTAVGEAETRAERRRADRGERRSRSGRFEDTREAESPQERRREADSERRTRAGRFEDTREADDSFGEAETKAERRRAVRGERRGERGEFEDTREARSEMDEAETKRQRQRAIRGERRDERGEFENTREARDGGKDPFSPSGEKSWVMPVDPKVLNEDDEAAEARRTKVARKELGERSVEEVMKDVEEARRRERDMEEAGKRLMRAARRDVEEARRSREMDEARGNPLSSKGEKSEKQRTTDAVEADREDVEEARRRRMEEAIERGMGEAEAKSRRRAVADDEPRNRRGEFEEADDDVEEARGDNARRERRRADGEFEAKEARTKGTLLIFEDAEDDDVDDIDTSEDAWDYDPNKKRSLGLANGEDLDVDAPNDSFGVDDMDDEDVYDEARAAEARRRERDDERRRVEEEREARGGDRRRREMDEAESKAERRRAAAREPRNQRGEFDEARGDDAKTEKRDARGEFEASEARGEARDKRGEFEDRGKNAKREPRNRRGEFEEADEETREAETRRERERAVRGERRTRGGRFEDTKEARSPQGGEKPRRMTRADAKNLVIADTAEARREMEEAPEGVAGRHQLDRDSDFADPRTRRFPMDNERTARSSIASVDRIGDPALRKMVHDKIKRKFPSLNINMDEAPEGRAEMDEAKLTAEQRNKLPDSDFALSKRRYPIPDEEHAKAAIARSRQFASKAEQGEIIRAVKRKFPKMDVESTPGSPTVGLHTSTKGGRKTAQDKSKK